MKKRRIKVNFTLIELLMAMSIFVILSLIMMRFFNSAQQIWSKVSQKNAVYADARVALDLMARELQSSMYNNDCTNATTYVRSIYPFWHQKIKQIDNSKTLDSLQPYLSNDYKSIYYNLPVPFEHTQLNFIAATDLKPDGAESNICEVRYGFVPVGEYLNSNNLKEDVGDATAKYDPYYDVGAPNNFQPPPYVPNTAQKENWVGCWEGWLIRSCTADKIKNSSIGTSFVSNTVALPLVPGTRTGWNFTTLPLKYSTGADGSSTRVKDIFKNESSNRWQRIIPGVYSLKFTCYGIDSSGNTVKIPSLKDDDITVPASLGAGNGMFTQFNTKLWVGTPFPVAIKIDLELFASADWFQWKAALANGDTSKAEKIKRNKLRTFTKTVFLDKKVSY